MFFPLLIFIALFGRFILIWIGLESFALNGYDSFCAQEMMKALKV
jgi:hypothetical protein